jgi:hypothetical protein
MTLNPQVIDAAVKRMRSVDLSYMPVYPGGQKQFDMDCQILAAAYLEKLSQETEVAEKDASSWRDDDCPQAENTFGVRGYVGIHSGSGIYS